MFEGFHQLVSLVLGSWAVGLLEIYLRWSLEVYKASPKDDKPFTQTTS